LAHVRRVWMTSSRLPKMRDEIRKLQEQIKELRAALDQLQSSREKGEK
jgi:prefoldin subunit 5